MKYQIGCLLSPIVFLFFSIKWGLVWEFGSPVRPARSRRLTEAMRALRIRIHVCYSYFIPGAGRITEGVGYHEANNRLNRRVTFPSIPKNVYFSRRQHEVENSPSSQFHRGQKTPVQTLFGFIER